MKQVREIVVPIAWSEGMQRWEAAALDNGVFTGIEYADTPDSLLSVMTDLLAGIMDETGGGHRYTLRFDVFDPTPDAEPEKK
jgi:hypothetical protein